MLSTFMEQHKLPNAYEINIEKYYQPLAENIYRQFAAKNNTFFVGINGCQGSGKSTLTDFIASYLTQTYQLNVAVLSLDDFYLCRSERKILGEKVHPLLTTRGVPGTHNTEHIAQVLAKLKNRETGFSLPRFNKATDEPFPRTEWEKVEKPVDIVLFEGWCWGVKHQEPEQLIDAINELEVQQDSEGVWRKYVNEQLEANYEPLYQNIDFWLALQAPSFDCVYQWRLEQEQKLKDRNAELTHSKIMSADEVLSFTQFFQRLSVHSCQTIGDSADAVFYLDYDRAINKVYSRETA